MELNNFLIKQITVHIMKMLRQEKTEHE